MSNGKIGTEFGKMIRGGWCPNSRMIAETGIPTLIITRFGGMPGIAQRLRIAILRLAGGHGMGM